MKANSLPRLTGLLLLGLLSWGTGRAEPAKDSGSLPETHDLSTLEWKLWGYRPHTWRNDFNFTRLSGGKAEEIGIPAKVPGSVQKALLDAGRIKDWNVGLGSCDIEWIENRHWLFVTRLPDEWLIKRDKLIRLQCRGLDDNGVVLVNGKEVGRFDNTFIPYTFDLGPALKEKDNTLAIVFECPPEYLGQIYWTSRIKQWKPRFYYGWDWVPRIVQIGVWNDLALEVVDRSAGRVESLRIAAEADQAREAGSLRLQADLTIAGLRGQVGIRLTDAAGRPVLEERVPATALAAGKTWHNLPVARWWPNGQGAQPLYRLTVELADAAGRPLQKLERTVGFKHVAWLPCEGAPVEADPWICSVNGRPVFLQGVNWTPIRPNFADLHEADYRKLLQRYRDLGVNVLRVWGGGFPEKDWFYDLCDELGLMLWQELPLSSSGLDNIPPEGAEEVATMETITRSYVRRLHHHVSLLIWCGGNELYDNGVPIDTRHRMIKRMEDVLLAEQAGTRFVPCSPSGPSRWGGLENFGHGVNWDTHGPWHPPFAKGDMTTKSVADYWRRDDALMHSEVGVPGAQATELTNRYRGDYPALPASLDNPLYRNSSWWIEWPEFLQARPDETEPTFEEYVHWSQHRQMECLTIALRACKTRFPRCGGFIIWMGHDCFPCLVNTSIIDFEGNPKPVARELERIWKDRAGTGLTQP